MNNNNFKKLTNDEKANLGEILTDYLNEVVELFDPSVVVSQKYLIEECQKTFKKLSIEEINECLKCYDSPYRKTKCSLIYNNKPVDCRYTKELVKRILHKLFIRNRTELVELNRLYNFNEQTIR